MSVKSEFLKKPIEHVDITRESVVPLVEAMGQMAYSARDLHRAATIYDRMLRDRDCGIILCLAGSLISAGLKRVFADMIRNHMVDAIVSSGANIVDQDFFEALGSSIGWPRTASSTGSTTTNCADCISIAYTTR